MSNQAENLPAIKIDLKAAGVFLNQYLVNKILMLIKKLKHLFPQANSIDICLKNETEQSTQPKIITVRFGKPGPEIIASESGGRWEVMLKNLEKKLVRQLQKEKQ
jgi:ribosome-associated translation inhibitor RaiA